jgi:hypothetical protein
MLKLKIGYIIICDIQGIILKKTHILHLCGTFYKRHILYFIFSNM